jgi:Flp pilus assembly pilin Flp
MHVLHSLSRQMRGNRRGISAMEYALLAAVVGGIVILAGKEFGIDLGNAFTTIGGKLSSTASPAPPAASAPTPPASPSPPTRRHYRE